MNISGVSSTHGSATVNSVQGVEATEATSKTQSEGLAEVHDNVSLSVDIALTRVTKNKLYCPSDRYWELCSLLGICHAKYWRVFANLSPARKYAHCINTHILDLFSC